MQKIFSEVWNTPLKTEQREVKPRDYLYASELGKAPIDVFLSMKGEIPSNPPNDRSKRKFESGDVWEWLVKQVLKRSGILKDAQLRNEVTLEGQCRVSGRLDFLLGSPDYDKAEQNLQELAQTDFPATFVERGYKLLEHLKTKYPEGLPDMIMELKSVSAFVFDALEARGIVRTQHKLQCYHYLKANNIKKGIVVYICRDDCRLMEMAVDLDDKKTAKQYEDCIKLYSGYYQRDEQPELEKPVVWDKDMGKFSKNNNIAWSNYLTKLYGIKDQFEFDETYGSLPAKFNRVVKRMKDKKDMTKANLEIIEEMKGYGFDPAEFVPEFYVAPNEENND